ncbi:MAG TPA: L-rhamnose mutarotase [Streptosporangiaceae bacterium]|jgi:L-rhamnose mutarotase|nr:L-rhamnose mutarotase [Streptosporangiaceae bacterium]
MRIALHTRVRTDRIEDYEQAHAAVPVDLTDAIRAAGVASWTIWRSGTDLFHVIDCADYATMLAALASNPVNVAWQGQLAELLETVHDYSGGGTAAALPVVWQL